MVSAMFKTRTLVHYLRRVMLDNTKHQNKRKPAHMSAYMCVCVTDGAAGREVTAPRNSLPW